MDATLLAVIPSALALSGTVAGLWVQHKAHARREALERVTAEVQEKINTTHDVLSSWAGIVRAQGVQIRDLSRKVEELQASEAKCQEERLALLRKITALESPH